MKKYRKIISILLIIAVLMTIAAGTTVSVSAAGESRVYFDNSSYNWENVYIYVYGTKENAEWPGELMEKDEASGLYTKTFPSTYASESVIFNNGLEKGEGKEQYPEAAGLPLKSGQCRLFTAENQWVDYGKADDHAYGFAYTASGTSFTDEYITVKLGVKNAQKGYYSLDGSSAMPYVNGDTVEIGKGKIGNSAITLTLIAVGEDGERTEQTYTYNKKYIPSETTFSADSDGHTTDAETGYYSTNPNLNLGKYKTISVDGNVSDWDSSMLIAQGVANDDPRVYMPSSMHEQPWDAYALYGAWDDENLYFMWEMANVTYIVSPSDNFAASNEARPWRNSIPMYLALSVDPEKQATGKAVGANLDGSTYTNPFVWGCDNGVAKDGGTAFTTHIDTLIAMDTNNSNGGASIFKADVQDTDGTYMFNYDSRITIGVTSFEKQDNQNGFKISHGNGTLSRNIIGVNGAKGTRVLGDNTNPGSNWVDFRDLGYKDSYGYVYEVAIPLSKLGIDREYIETKGIGAMQILTYGTSGMDCLPHDPSMLDCANEEYSYDPSTSHEKEDVDNITVPLARVGALLEDTVINEAAFEVDFGADKNSGQLAGTDMKLSAQPYNHSGDVTYEFKVNGDTIQKSSSPFADWTPFAGGTYELTVIAVDSLGRETTRTKTFDVIDLSGEITAGDVDGNGRVDITDAVIIQKYLAKMKNDKGMAYIDDEDSYQLAAADYDGSKKVDVKDATAIQKMLAGIK